jgi:hypothetical protein
MVTESLLWFAIALLPILRDGWLGEKKAAAASD